MKTKLKGLRDIASTHVGQPRRTRTQDEIFNELAKVNWEKVRLNKEKINFHEGIERMDARLKQIESRLKQIAETEKLLHQRMEQMTAKNPKRIDQFNNGSSHPIADKDSHKEVVIKY